MSKSAEHREQVWEQARKTIAQAERSLASSRDLTPEQEQAELRRRAKNLARKPHETRSGEQIEVVTFLLAREHYAIESHYVREVHIMRRFTPLPYTPTFVLGVTSIHGRIVSVLDLREFFGLPRQGMTELNKLLVLQAGQMSFGVLADDVTGSRHPALADLQESVHTITDARESYVRGITSDRLIVLDGQRLITDRRIVVSDKPYSEQEI